MSLSSITPPFNALSIATCTYITYILIAILITWLVARTLSKNGAVFLIDGLGNEQLAQSINHMLVVGFYLVNLGIALMHLSSRSQIESVEKAITFLAAKLGVVLLVVGVAHFFNLFLISQYRSQKHSKAAV